VLALAASMLLLMKATQELPIGTVYAVWTGIGAFGAVVADVIFFQEPASFWRLFFLSTPIISIDGLKVVSK
jgi:quaternary ammonium compound-resistance protein SugE